MTQDEIRLIIAGKNELAGPLRSAQQGVRQFADGTIAGVQPTVPEAQMPVRKRIVAILPPPVTRPVVPYIETVHNRAAIEIQEEAGFEVAPEQIEILGGALFSSAGTSDEKVYLAAAEVDPGTQGPLSGDGSPMEEAARVFFLPLEEALEKSMRGEFEDGKTELCLWRLAWERGLIRKKEGQL